MGADLTTMGVGAGLGLIGSIGSMFGIKKANKRLDQLLAENPAYAKSMYAQNQLGLAQTMFKGRMAGAGSQEQNIFNAQASMLGGASRNVGDSSRMLAMAGMAQGQANEGFADLGMAESQNKYSMLNNLNTAYGGMIAEDDKMFGDQVRRYGDKTAVRSIQQKNRQAPWLTLQNLGGSIAGFGAAGGLKKQ